MHIEFQIMKQNSQFLFIENICLIHRKQYSNRIPWT